MRHVLSWLGGLALALTVLLTFGPASATAEKDAHIMQESPAWQADHIDDIRLARAESGRPWREFLRVPDLFSGLYEIPAGGTDSQSPHDADEVYYVLAGRAVLTVEADSIPVEPGSVIYVAKDREHRFVEITEGLSVLVFFATPGEDEG